MGSDRLSAALADLRDRVEATCFPLDVPGAGHARLARRELVDQLGDYLLPRLAAPRAPLLAVVGGSTGAGRSTLVNALVGRDVTRAGPLRPTTRVPVLVCRSGDRHWFARDRDIAVCLDERVPPGIALLDVPDIDSVSADNRRVAVRLLGAADLWIFVTTAARYADAAPWHMLRLARERDTRLALVLDRVPAEDIDTVRADFVRLLRQAGFGDVPLYVIPEVAPGPSGPRLPERHVVPIRTWLAARGADPDARDAVVRGTLGGLLHSLDRRVPALARAVNQQREAVAWAHACVDRAYGATARWALRAVEDGSLLRGAAATRWRDGDEEGTARAVRTGLDALAADAIARGAERSARCLPQDAVRRVAVERVTWARGADALTLIAAVAGAALGPGIGREAAGRLGTRMGSDEAARRIVATQRRVRGDLTRVLDGERVRRAGAVRPPDASVGVDLMAALDAVRARA